MIEADPANSDPEPAPFAGQALPRDRGVPLGNQTARPFDIRVVRRPALERRDVPLGREQACVVLDPLVVVHRDHLTGAEDLVEPGDPRRLEAARRVVEDRPSLIAGRMDAVAGGRDVAPLGIELPRQIGPEAPPPVSSLPGTGSRPFQPSRSGVSPVTCRATMLPSASPQTHTAGSASRRDTAARGERAPIAATCRPTAE